MSSFENNAVEGDAGAVARVLIIGCGIQSRYWAQAVSRIATVVGVADLSEAAARLLGDELGVPWYTEIPAAFHALRGQIDICYVAVPVGFHQSVVLEILESVDGSDKVGTLVEKPAAQTRGAVRTMVAAAEQQNCPLAFAYDREHLGLDSAREMVSRIGLQRAGAVWTRRWVGDADIPVRNAVDPRVGGGSWWDLGAHMVKLVTGLIGDELPATVTGNGHGLRGPGLPAGEADVHFSAFLRWPSGLFARVTVNWLSDNDEWHLSFIGERGWVRIDRQGDEGLESFVVTAMIDGELVPAATLRSVEEARVDQLRELFEAVRHSRAGMPWSVTVGSEEGERNVQILEAGHRSANQGGTQVNL